MKRLLSFILCALLLTTMLWGCQIVEEDVANNDTELPSVSATEQETIATEPAESTEMTSVPETEATEEENTQTADGIDADFKATMDSYEAFFEEYCAFMKKYQENPTDLGLLADYAVFMQQYTETMEAMENLENDDLNTAELAYYVEVNARITKMLLEVAG